MENIKDTQVLQKIEQMLNALNRVELVSVNRMVVHRIKIMDDLYRLAANSQFEPGQRVSWKDYGGIPHTGIILKINRKTISVKEDGDNQGIWKVTAGLLTRI